MTELPLFENVPMPEIRITEAAPELRYPQMPGARAMDTSRAAAEAIKPDAATLRARALELLQAKPMTADEVAEAMGESVLAIRPRITELKKFELIEDTGERRTNRSGRLAAVWRAR